MARRMLLLLSLVVAPASGQTSPDLVALTDRPAFRGPGPSGCRPYQWFGVEGRTLKRLGGGDPGCTPEAYPLDDALADLDDLGPFVDELCRVILSDDTRIDWRASVVLIDGELVVDVPALEADLSAGDARNAGRILHFAAAAAAERGQWDRFTVCVQSLIRLVDLMSRSESILGSLSAGAPAQGFLFSAKGNPGGGSKGLLNDAAGIPDEARRRILRRVETLDVEQPWGLRSAFESEARVYRDWFRRRWVEGDETSDDLVTYIADLGMTAHEFDSMRQWMSDPIQQALSDVAMPNMPTRTKAKRLTKDDLRALVIDAERIAIDVVEVWSTVDGENGLIAARNAIVADQHQAIRLMGFGSLYTWTVSRHASAWLQEFKAELTAPDRP